ncbi:MAG: diguanylate cyclase [Eubacteriales bacterium]|nr:diguanylate cyclase [Eubacteriales bacterium]
MHREFSIGLIYNLSLLLVLSLIFSIVNTRIDKTKWWRDLLAGILIGIIGIAIMGNPVLLIEGVFFDGRSILLSMTGLFFGVVPTMIAVLLTGVYRLFIGGDGALAGLATILTSTFIGFIWRKYRLQKYILDKTYFPAVELYVFGIVVHMVMLADLYLFIPQRDNMLQIVALPIMALYPVASVFLGLVIKNQIDKTRMIQKMEESEERYRTIFENIYAAMLILDPENGNILDANKFASLFYGYSIEKLKSMHMTDINGLSHDELKSEMDKAMNRLKNIFIFTHMLSNGEARKVEIHSGPLTVNGKKVLYSIIHDITDRINREKEIEYLSFHDQLTGLYNRRFYEAELKRLDTSRNLPISIIMADVNGLKLVNDAFGHHEGDNLLTIVSDILKDACREDDIISRIGGDEFIVLLPKTIYTDAYAIIQRMKANEANYNLNGMEISISYGVATKTSVDVSISSVYRDAEDNMYKNKFFESRKLKGNMIDTIMKTLYEKNPREKNHSERVSILCQGMAKALNFNHELTNEIGIAGLLHDIGKITLDEAILNKRGLLNRDEWFQMKKHSETSYKILSSVNGLATIAEYVLSHHERWDGEGYPNKLAGDEIPYFSRIIALADAFDAMVSERTYRRSLTFDEAIAEIEANAGTQFDPHLSEIFLRTIKNQSSFLD